MNEFTIGLGTTLIGMGVVSITLLALSFILDLFKVCSVIPSPKIQSLPEQHKEKAMVEMPQGEHMETSEELDELQIIAVITAVIAASLGTTTDKLHIQSYKRVSPNPSGWNAAGRRENMKNSSY